MWQIHYLRARDLEAHLLAEADHERLARTARSTAGRRPTPGARRAIAVAARAVERTATSIAAWAEARPA